MLVIPDNDLRGGKIVRLSQGLVIAMAVARELNAQSAERRPHVVDPAEARRKSRVS